MTMARISKPLIVLVRGGCYGIAYTLLGHATLVYCTPDAEFKTPFMESAQSPEGTSTLLFPQTYGTKVANEILLTDRRISAKEAVKFGFANSVINQVDFTREFIDPDIIPAIPKLLSYDANTVKWNMRQVLLSKDLKRIEEVTKREA